MTAEKAKKMLRFTRARVGGGMALGATDPEIIMLFRTCAMFSMFGVRCQRFFRGAHSHVIIAPSSFHVSFMHIFTTYTQT